MFSVEARWRAQFGTSPLEGARATGPLGVPSLFDRVDAEGRLYVAGIRAVLLEFAQSNDVVLMGRGGQWLLQHIPHALHVRVSAPFDVRVARLAQQTGGETGRTSPSRAFIDVVRHDDP